jgi:hypothetical protein
MIRRGVRIRAIVMAIGSGPVMGPAADRVTVAVSVLKVAQAIRMDMLLRRRPATTV